MLRTAAPLCLTWLSVVAGLAATAPSVATAQMRVAVERFGGPQGGALRTALISDLEDNGVVVVGRDEMADQAANLGLGGRYSDEDYVQLGQALRVSAFIDGRVSRARRRWALQVRVRNAADGQSLGSAAWGGRTAAALRGIRRNGYERLSGFLSSASAPSAPPPAAPDPITADPGGRPWYAADDPEDPSDDEDEDEDDAEPVEVSRRQDALVLAGLVGTLRRSMATTALVAPCFRGDPSSCGPGVPGAPDDTSATLLTEDRAYASNGLGHMEIGVYGELYPGAFSEDQAVPWFGAVFHFRNAILLSSTGEGCVGESRCPTVDFVDVKTTQRELYFGARGRFRIGEERRSPHLYADLGYGAFLFSLDPADLQLLERSGIVPPINYSYVSVGGGFTYGLVPVYLQAGVSFAYRLGLGVGNDAKRIWGTDTTNSSGLSIGVELRSEAPYVADGAFFSLTVQYFRFTTTFQGQTACQNPNMCETSSLWELWPYTPNTASPEDLSDVRGGLVDPVTDSYLRLSLALGYALR